MRECRPTRSNHGVEGLGDTPSEVEWQYQKLDASRSFAASWVSRESPILLPSTVPDSFGPQKKIEHALVRSAELEAKNSPLKCRAAKPSKGNGSCLGRKGRGRTSRLVGARDSRRWKTESGSKPN